MPDEAFAAEVQREVVDKLRDSACAVTIFTGKVDWKLAIETGAAVLLDKPIILCVAPGTRIPDKVVRIADHIIEGDLTTPAGRARLTEALCAVVGGIAGRP